MLKKIFLSVASLFLLWQSYNLLLSINRFDSEVWFEIIFAAWILNLFITGIFAFAGFAFPTQKLAPKNYYSISQPKRLKKVYKILQVDLFRKMLLATLWKNKSQRKRYFDGSKEGISNLEVQSMKSEFGHLIPFIIICFVCIYLFAIGLNKLGLFSLLINWVGNFYPIILQRHHRMRIEILRRRMPSRSKLS